MTDQSALPVWVVVPTYQEAATIERHVARVLAALPGATVLVVDDASPDGTGLIADRLAAADGRVRVRHRAGKEGLGPAYLDGFARALEGGAGIIVQIDADGSHDPAALAALVEPIRRGEADLVLGSRWVAGGGTVDWPLGRRLLSRGGSSYARLILGLGVRDLTGGYKAWRASTLAALELAGIRAGGYVFQIEMTWRAARAGARIVELPITFRERTAGASKMSRRIVIEALLLVLRLRLGR